MKPGEIHAVTGALGYTGQAIARRLIARGVRVRTLTGSPRRPNPFGEKLEIRPLAFHDPGALAESLRGCSVLYNTYWVRFNHRLFTFDQARCCLRLRLIAGPGAAAPLSPSIRPSGRPAS